MIDCQVSDWSDWSKCDVACGIGTLTRTREVLRPESNGGRQCPSLEESRSCRATRCSSRQLDKISALKGNKKYNNCHYKQNIKRIPKRVLFITKRHNIGIYGKLFLTKYKMSMGRFWNWYNSSASCSKIKLVALDVL